MVAVIAGFLTFVVALLIGGVAIYISARLIVDVDNYSRAVSTALIGAIVWAVMSWIPLIGLVLALFVWIGVIHWRYPGNWRPAAAIGFVAWLAAVIIIYVLNAIFRLGISIFGVPGT